MKKIGIFIKSHLNKLLSYTLLIASLVNMCVTAIPVVNANAYDNFGTNLALGSPVLNQNAVSDDWNKYETIVWGIYLSNFCIPFVDNYESAFNLGSSSGSQGRGFKSLAFGSGSDPSNNNTIKDLVTYAINNQEISAKRIKVSHNYFSNGTYTTLNVFSGGGDSSEGSAGTSRYATLGDLFLKTVDSVGELDNTTSWVKNVYDGNKGKLTTILAENSGSGVHYPEIAGVVEGSIPTFAVDRDGGYEIVFDYRESYDIEMFVGALSAALCSEYKELAADFLNKNNWDELPLYVDTFGNICTLSGNKYIVVIPAAANQYLTKEPSINLLNSLIFNSLATSNTKENIMLNAGQSSLNEGWFRDLFSGYAGENIGGTAAFTNNSSRLRGGGMVLFHDTDTVVVQDHIKSGKTIGEGQMPDIGAGETLKTLFDLDITDPAEKTQFKIEPLFTGSDLVNKLDGEKKDIVLGTINSASSLVNLLESSGAKKRLTYMMNVSTGKEMDLFTETYIVPVHAKPAQMNNGSLNEWSVYRKFPDFLYRAYKGTVADLPSNMITTHLSNTTMGTMFDNLVLSDKKLSTVAITFMTNNAGGVFDPYKSVDESGAYDIKLASIGITGGPDALVMRDVKDKKNAVKTNFTYEGGGWFGREKIDNDEFSQMTLGRNVKIYQVSDVLEEVCNVLGVRDGTDFSVFASHIYVTYLDWYDVDVNKLTGEASANMNPNIINEKVAVEDITDVTRVKSQEDLEKEVLNYTYLMLDPVGGKEYRSQILMSNMSSWIYEQYQRIVYGGADTYYYSTVTTKTNTGFLSVDTYSENFMTSWFMDKYPTYAIVLIAAGAALLIVVGVLKRRKISWFILGMFAIISVTLIMPSTGEIVPLVANNVVQDLFDENMTFWSISEQASNANMEVTEINNSDLEGSEASEVKSLVDFSKALYLDRYLSIKQDISNKVNLSANENLSDIQEMKSTRWLLPMVMRQYTNNENNADYVYVTLGDKLEDMSNLYWFFKPSNAQFTNTINAKAELYGYTPTVYGGSGSPDHTYGIYNSGNRKSYYSGYIDTFSGADPCTYRSIAYETQTNDYGLVHNYFYLLDDTIINKSFTDIHAKDYDTYDDWATKLSEELSSDSAGASAIRSVSADIQEYAPEYNRYDRGTINDVYGYLWATESNLHYFYGVVKDSFNDSDTLASLVANLQGEYVEYTNSMGLIDEYRKSFMTDPETGEVRDILDLEHLFTNTIPYLYSVQIMAAGYDDNSGVFTNEMIADYKLYKDNKVSWLFKSNWVTKLMENPDNHRHMDVYYYDETTGDRKKLEIVNPMIPQYYSDIDGDGIVDTNSSGDPIRPMIFSKAQMFKYGLDESDLNVIELKCIAANEEIYQKWTLLLNYVGVSGMTKEVMMRQMAIDAALTFNENFTTSGMTNQALAMHPSSLDLRSISFDSVMKMLMLNVTKDTSYIYGDTMEVLVDESDVFTSLLLLVVAFLCAFLIPLVRNIALGLMFYLGFAAILKALFKDATEKAKTGIGYLGSHLVYLGINIIYLLAFKLLMNMTSTEDVLTLGSNNIAVGNPVWCLVVVLIISGLFTWASFKMCILCIKNYADMGYTALKGSIEMIGMNISSGFEKMIDKMNEAAEVGLSGESGSKPIANPVNQGGSTSSGSSGSGDGRGSNGRKVNNSEYSEPGYGEDYYYETAHSSYVDDDSSDINDTIERGKQQEDKKK